MHQRQQAFVMQGRTRGNWRLCFTVRDMASRRCLGPGASRLERADDAPTGEWSLLAAASRLKRIGAETKGWGRCRRRAGWSGAGGRGLS